LLNKVTVHDPICHENGDLALALNGSFLPVPSVEKFTSASANVVPLVSVVCDQLVEGQTTFLYIMCLEQCCVATLEIVYFSYYLAKSR